MFISTPYQNQDQMKAELASQISDLEEDITRWEKFPGIWSDFLPQFAKPLFPKRLLFQPDPVVVTGMPIPSDVASSVPAPPQSLGLPQMRAGRAIKRPRQSSLCRLVTSEASSMAPTAHSPWRAVDYNVPAQFREMSAEYLGHFRAPRSPPAPIMRPFPTHFTLPNNQPVVSGFLLPNNLPVVSSVPVQSTLPVVGIPTLACNLPIVGNNLAPNNPPVAGNCTIISCVPVETSPPVPINPPTQRGRDVLTKLPKSLLFDGCSNWLLFKRKFERYARMQDWSDEECGGCLGWCLTGKAVDFYALLTKGRGTLPYAELMQRLQKRFGARELPATAQGRFQDVQQKVGESLDDWSDRVLTLATTAFRDLPYAYATEQAVTKFCHGLLDKEAGKHVSLQLPKSMGDAMNSMKLYSHVQLACATAPMDSQKGEREESMCVHEVRRAPSPGTVSGSAVDKLTQVVDRILGYVERLSISCGSQDDDSRVRQPVQVFRSDGGERLYGEYAAEGSNEDGTQNLGFNKQRQVRCPEGTGGGGPRGHRNQHAYERGPAQMLTMGALGTGKTTGTVVDSQIQKSALRDRSEAGMVQIGASIP
ncbi:hypothetical protein DPMN_006443 [Dreissena polymorpha]|uniref:Retrotransposon gag domain-containing protein n=1 Tax=Dreissena polymorpha TaxID=45954 RepID=A0A9D4MU55_DREPO|nr:hypothetical protein DPMN_006443 [Dreissena polymorpha]